MMTQKVDLSIFTYLNSFQNLKPGAYLNTIVRRTEKRNQQVIVLLFFVDFLWNVLEFSADEIQTSAHQNWHN